MTDPIARMKAARKGFHVTTPASRHAAMIAKKLIKGEVPPQITEEPELVGESIASTVAHLW